MKLMTALVPQWLLVIVYHVSQSLMFGRFDPKRWGRNFPQRSTVSRLLCCLLVSIHVSGISIPLSLSFVTSYSFFNSSRVTVRVSITNPNPVPQWMMPDLIGGFRNG